MLATDLDPQTPDVREIREMISQINDGGMLTSHSRVLSEGVLLP